MFYLIFVSSITKNTTMSLDVSLTLEHPITIKSSGIFIRENGSTKEISESEWKERFGDREPVRVVSCESNEIFTKNITHNLGKMAAKAGIYEHLWRPDELNIYEAAKLIVPLSDGLFKLLSDVEYFKTFNPENGWGSYDTLVEFVSEYLKACITYPNATITVCR